jgi:hypothetical protein
MGNTTRDRIAQNLPKLLSAIDRTLEWLFNTVIHPAFALILAVVLVVLVTTNVISLIVAFSIGIAWVVSMLWIARSNLVKGLTVFSRLVLLLVIGLLLLGIGNRFGNWALEEYKKQKASEQKPQPGSPSLVADIIQFASHPLAPSQSFFGQHALWLVDKQNKTVTPVDIILLIRIVNPQPIEILLDSVRIEVKGRNSWIQLQLLGTDNLTAVLDTPIGTREVVIDPEGVYEAISKPILPGKTITATAFCEMPEKLASMLPSGTVRLKLLLRDTADRTFTFETSGSPEEPGFGESGKTRVKIGDVIDISKFHLKRVLFQGADQ